MQIWTFKVEVNGWFIQYNEGSGGYRLAYYEDALDRTPYKTVEPFSTLDEAIRDAKLNGSPEERE